MPAASRRLQDEGVVISPTRAGDDVLQRLAHEMRNPPQRLADLRAQRAANLTGERRLLGLIDRNGLDRVKDGVAEILDYAERRTRARLPELPHGAYQGAGGLGDDARAGGSGGPLAGG